MVAGRSLRLSLAIALVAVTGVVGAGCNSESSKPSEECRQAVRLAGGSLVSFISVADARGEHQRALVLCESWFATRPYCLLMIQNGLSIVDAIERGDRAEALKLAGTADLIQQGCADES